MTLTVTDQFCGAGGSSLGADIAGLEVKIALNHWQQALETHATNFPDAGHDCADVSSTDPRRYPPTDVLLTSPECTHHSYAGGRSARMTNPQLFEDDKTRLKRLEAERSRATMWDVPRFAEVHAYRAIVVENVVQARKWVMWDAWWQAMEALGYEGQILYLNSMFFPPTPQSRDRMYVVWIKAGQPTPNLDFRPTAVCVPCGEVVAAIQTWKRADRPWGRYGVQYTYKCPHCAQQVEPAYTPAAWAIDWTDLGQRIGDRDRPLAENTVARIRAGLDRYGMGDAHVQVGGNTYERGDYARYRPVDQVLFTQPGTRQTALLAMPFITELRANADARPVDEPLSTIVASGNHHALTTPLVMRNNTGGAEMVTPVDEALRTLTTAGHQSLVVPYYGSSEHGKPADEPLGTLTTRDRFALVVPSGGTWNEDATSVGEALRTLTTRDAYGLLVPTDRSYLEERGAQHPSEPLRTQTTCQSEALVATVPDRPVAVEDCGFRMLQPPEIGRGMAFPDSYQVLGNKREQVKQYGNAVTPPVSAWIVGRIVDALSEAA